jgi:putative membrane protein
MTSKQYHLLLLGLFLLYWVLMAISPLDRHDWALENVLAVIFVVSLLVSYKRFPLSTLSYTLIFLFMLLHETGAHYTYAKVPYDEWFQFAFGFSLNEWLGFERNHFDRAVHFLYGFLLVYPLYELFQRYTQVHGFWGYFMPVNLIMSTSMIFELFEWGAAGLFGGDLGIAYLGTQGDVWDAHKDMLLASVGAVIPIVLAYWYYTKKRDVLS